MKRIALATLLALACPLLAQGRVAAPVSASLSSARASAVEEKAQAYISLHQKIQEVFRQLGVQLETVHDKESADAAAPEIARLATTFTDTMERAEALGEPSPEVEAAVVAYMNSRAKEIDALAEDVVGPMVAMLLDSPACYGSEALSDELTRLFSALRDAAWCEDEELTGCEGDDEDPSAGEAEEEAEEELEDTEEEAFEEESADVGAEDAEDSGDAGDSGDAEEEEES